MGQRSAEFSKFENSRIKGPGGGGGGGGKLRQQLFYTNGQANKENVLSGKKLGVSCTLRQV